MNIEDALKLRAGDKITSTKVPGTLTVRGQPLPAIVDKRVNQVWEGPRPRKDAQDTEFLKETEEEVLQHVEDSSVATHTIVAAVDEGGKTHFLDNVDVERAEG